MRKTERLSGWKKVILTFVVLMLALGASSVIAAPREVQAATMKLKTVNGKTYGYKGKTKLVDCWANIDGGWRYFKPGTGEMAVNYFMTTDKGNTYYLNSKGKRVFGWQTIKDSSGNKNRYYFDPKNAKVPGRMNVGFIKVDGKRYYMRETASSKGGRGSAIVGGVFNGVDGRKYWANSKGAFKSGFRTTKNGKYFFTAAKGMYKNAWFNWKNKRYRASSSGALLTGWHHIDGYDYYFRPSGSNKGQLIQNKSNFEIGDYLYSFDSKGRCTGKKAAADSAASGITAPTSARTIKNFLKNALLPITKGPTPYVYGGGHSYTEATRKGIIPKGMDCSGYVGWSIYQVLQKKSGQTMYTVTSGEVGSIAKKYGYGKIYTWEQLSGKFKAGDIGYDVNHTWIVLGQCKDKSLVILHAPHTGDCIRIAGTESPVKLNQESEAIKLAKKYMQKLCPGVQKYGLDGCWTSDYFRRGAYVRWKINAKTGLTDPDGYLKMTADQILKDLTK